MAKAGELDWSELHKTGKLEEDPAVKQYSAPVKKDYHNTGTKPTEEDLRKDAEFIMKGWIDTPQAQWRDEDECHKEVVTQEQAEEMKKNWENIFQNFYEAGREPINKSKQDVDWGTGKSFNDSLTDEERLRRNMHVERGY